ncbi:hypothetical protein GCM10023335_27150 [Streptomyces siamensis]|uniref:Uncharacterized protein n=1 Tax=Streptomyces siamensis TaxID=1274986 RepID=A0ABP9IU76_9ACTN
MFKSLPARPAFEDEAVQVDGPGRGGGGGEASWADRGVGRDGQGSREAGNAQVSQGGPGVPEGDGVGRECSRVPGWAGSVCG